VVLCASSTLLLAPTPRARLALAPLPKSASNNLRKWFLSPTGRLNLGIITEGKLTVVLIIPSSWGFPTGPMRHQQHRLIFFAHQASSAEIFGHFHTARFKLYKVYNENDHSPKDRVIVRYTDRCTAASYSGWRGGPSGALCPASLAVLSTTKLPIFNPPLVA
jgi:hypothetical protein